MMKSDPDHGTSETLGVAPARPEHLNRIRSELTADLRHRPATAQRHQNRHPSWPRRAGRLLSILALSALCILPDRASADQLKPHESLASEISSRQRCACSTWRIHHRRYRGVRTAYLIGNDPLPYRFGTATVWGPPYRYYWR